MSKIHEAVDILFGKDITTPELLINEFEAIYKAFAYNHIHSEDASMMNNNQACNALYNIEILIDGLRGKNLQA